MTIALILFFGILTVLLGRWMFGRWFNHVGLYGVIWSSSLALFHVGLITYYPLESETWMVIVAGWLAFVLGSITVLAARYALTIAHETTGNRTQTSMTERSLLLQILWIVNVVVAADAAHQVYIVSRLVGNISNILALGNLLYSFRIHEGIPGAIPYLGSITLTACLLAGYYTSVVGRLKLVAIVPVLAVIVISIANMGRALIVIGAILFVTGYYLNTTRLPQGSGSSFPYRFKRALMVVLVGAVLVSGMEIVRGNRGMIEGFAGATTTLRKLGVGAGSFVTPSIVMYATAHHGVLNQYLKKGTEDPPIGNYSLAPMWRVLSKVGFQTHVAHHQPFYSIPMNANTGSYLRELHADYGMAGVVFGPFFLGLLTTFFWVRYEASRALGDLIVLGHIYVVVGMSLVVFATQLGYWLASLIFGLLLSFAYTRALRARERSKNRALVYA